MRHADTRLLRSSAMVRIGDLTTHVLTFRPLWMDAALGEGKAVTVRPALPAFMTSSSPMCIASVTRMVMKSTRPPSGTFLHDARTNQGEDLKPAIAF